MKGWRTSFLSEYFEEPQQKRTPSWQAIRNDQWKYIRYTELQGMDELFDVKKDPGEMKNLIHDAPAVLTALKKDLDQFNQLSANAKDKPARKRARRQDCRPYLR